MSRVALTDGSGRWFDPTKARSWDEERVWNGQNHISKATGSQWDHERLYLTASGKWILNRWSQWLGKLDTFEEITREEAAAWFARNEMDPPEELVDAVDALEV